MRTNKDYRKAIAYFLIALGALFGVIPYIDLAFNGFHDLWLDNHSASFIIALILLTTAIVILPE